MSSSHPFLIFSIVSVNANFILLSFRDGGGGGMSSKLLATLTQKNERAHHPQPTSSIHLQPVTVTPSVTTHPTHI